MFNQNSTSAAHVRWQWHLSCPWSVPTPSLLPMFFQWTICTMFHDNIIFPAYFQLVHHLQSVHQLFYQCSVSIPSVLSMSRKHTHTLPHVLSVHYICTIFTAHIQSEYRLSCPCAVSTPHLLPKPSQYAICPANVKSEYLSTANNKINWYLQWHHEFIAFPFRS